MRFHLRILTPEMVVLEDNVDSVQVPALDGLYELLPNHAPIFLALASGVVRMTQAGEVETWTIQSGTCHMENNHCTLSVVLEPDIS